MSEEKTARKPVYDTEPCEGRQTSPSNPTNSACVSHLTKVITIRCTAAEKEKLILDGVSHYVVAWKLCTSKTVHDVTDTLNLALEVSGCSSVKVEHKPRLLSDNGPCYIAEDLGNEIAAFIDHYNHHRYYVSLGNLKPADVYFGRGQAILDQRQRIKQKTIQSHRLQHQSQAATDELKPPVINANISPKAFEDRQPVPHRLRIEVDNNSVERTIWPIALNRKNALFAGHDAGAENWEIIASLIETCKLDGIDPHAWLARTLKAIVNGHKHSNIHELLPRNYPRNV